MRTNKRKRKQRKNASTIQKARCIPCNGRGTIPVTVTYGLYDGRVTEDARRRCPSCKGQRITGVWR